MRFAFAFNLVRRGGDDDMTVFPYRFPGGVDLVLQGACTPRTVRMLPTVAGLFGEFEAERTKENFKQFANICRRFLASYTLEKE